MSASTSRPHRTVIHPSNVANELVAMPSDSLDADAMKVFNALSNHKGPDNKSDKTKFLPAVARSLGISRSRKIHGNSGGHPWNSTELARIIAAFSQQYRSQLRPNWLQLAEQGQSELVVPDGLVPTRTKDWLVKHAVNINYPHRSLFRDLGVDNAFAFLHAHQNNQPPPLHLLDDQTRAAWEAAIHGQTQLKRAARKAESTSRQSVALRMIAPDYESELKKTNDLAMMFDQSPIGEEPQFPDGLEVFRVAPDGTNDVVMNRFAPAISIDHKFKRIDVCFRDVPAAVSVCSQLINWAINAAQMHVNNPQSFSQAFNRFGLKPEGLDSFMNTQLSQDTGEYDIRLSLGAISVPITSKTDDIRFQFDPSPSVVDTGYREYILDKCASLTTTLSTLASDGAPSAELMQYVSEWLVNAQTALNNRTMKSDTYAKFQTLSQFNIQFKFIKHRSSGSVILKNPERFNDPERGELLFCPDADADCFFHCLDHWQGKNGPLCIATTIWKIKAKLDIHSSITTRQIRAVISEIEKDNSEMHMVIIIHSWKDGQFKRLQSDCTVIPAGATVTGKTQIHLIDVFNHYVVVYDLDQIKQLNQTDFEQIKDVKDTDLSQLGKCPEDINAAELRCKPVTEIEHQAAWYDEPLEQGMLGDSTIRKRIQSYQQQDVNAGRASDPADYITVADVRKCLASTNFRCYLSSCTNPQLTIGNWTLDRVDSSLPHVHGNIQPCCAHCNKSKKADGIDEYLAKQDETRHIYFYDFETFPDVVQPTKGNQIEHVHTLYSVGITEVLPCATGEDEDSWAERLLQHTKTHFGIDTEAWFTKYLCELDAKLKAQVSSEISKWASKMASKMKNDPTITAEKIAEWREIKMHKECEKKRVLFYAHNGARYDTQFIFKLKGLEFHKVINSSGIISLLTKSGCIEFRDSYRMLTNSLDNLCRSYKLPEKYSKTHFPHAWMTRERVTQLEQNDDPIPMPPAEYWPTHEVPSEFRGKQIKMKELSDTYQRLDCVALCLIWFRFDKMVRAQTATPSCTEGRHAHMFLTAPALAYHILLSNMSNDVFVMNDRKLEKWMRQSVRGGRCFAQKGSFKSQCHDELVQAIRDSHNQVKSILDSLAKGKCTKEQAQEQINTAQAQAISLYEGCQDWLTDVDACSLYPSAMTKFNYPTGKPRWATQKERMEMAELFNRAVPEDDVDAFKYIGIIEAKLNFDEAVRTNYVCPLLSHHDDRTKTLQYTFEDATMVATTVDVFEACRYNKCHVMQIDRALIWPARAPIFRNALAPLYELRLMEKKRNPVLAETLKLILNSAYGKLLQKINDDQIQLFGDDSESLKQLDELWNKYKINGNEIPLRNGSQVMVDVKREVRMNKRLTQLGTMILSFSKVIMNQFIHAINGFTNWESTFYYTDTDSLHIDNRVLEDLKKRNVTTTSIAVQFDPITNKPTSVELKPNEPILGTHLGQLHDDITEAADGKIISAVFVRPKLYIDEIIGYSLASKQMGLNVLCIEYHKRAKGIQSSSWNRVRVDMDDDPVGDNIMGLFTAMLNGSPAKFYNRQFKREMNKAEKGAVITQYTVKWINNTLWEGRVYDQTTGRFQPITPTLRKHQQQLSADEDHRSRCEKALVKQGHLKWKSVMQEAHRLMNEGQFRQALAPTSTPK